jgi:DNA-binding LytR/AlgR family response regulator
MRKETIVENDKKTIKLLIIQKGTQRITVATDSIYCITAESPYVAIHTQDKKYLYSTTLTSLTSILDKNQFVRIHKSTIIHIGKMSSYVSRKNGDYDVMLENGIKKRMSRTFTSGFISLIK